MSRERASRSPVEGDRAPTLVGVIGKREGQPPAKLPYLLTCCRSALSPSGWRPQNRRASSPRFPSFRRVGFFPLALPIAWEGGHSRDRKSTRLNSSHLGIS